jgi:sugar phosphate permease
MSPLALALPAMTLLQAIVALGTFSLSVLAPQLGLSVTHLGLLNAMLFGIGALGSLHAGRLIRCIGDLQLACCCLLAVAAAMLCLAAGSALGMDWAVWPAALLLGFAFGPETPASTSVLARVTPAARRPLVFSVRQTGNQLGAIAGSLALPLLLIADARLPFACVSVMALVGGLWCAMLARGARLRLPPNMPIASTLDSGALARVLTSRALLLLALATLAYSATQVCLNTFLMSYLVRERQQAAVEAAQMVALLQTGGLAGRLFWGWAAQRIGAGGALTTLLGALGLLMAASGAALVTASPAGGALVFCLLAVATGFTASGWNGVMIAEIARIAGPDRAGELTGAVLMFGYAGLALAPLAFVAAGTGSGMIGAFLLLFACAAAAGLALAVFAPRSLAARRES